MSSEVTIMRYSSAETVPSVRVPVSLFLRLSVRLSIYSFVRPCVYTSRRE